MNIVVMGGRGLVGRNIVERLRRQGHAVSAASRASGVDVITGRGLAQSLVGADVVVDVTGSTAAQADAVDLVRRGGTVVLGGRTPKKTVSFVMDKLTARGIKMVGVRAHESEDVRKALAVITARREQLSNLLTHEVSLREADLALRLIGQEIPGEEAIHVAINPWRE